LVIFFDIRKTLANHTDLLFFPSIRSRTIIKRN
jgi:hypothetical protein